MVKSRFTSADIAAMVQSLRPQLLGARVANVYDIGGKIFLLKFSSSLITAGAAEVPEVEDELSSSSKSILLIEAGTRFHLTWFERSKASIPSGWTMNLRKLLKGKQVEKFEQIGADRVVLIQFGTGERAVNVVLEMYAKGNIVVTDSEWRVQLLLRSHTFDDSNVTGKNLVYPIQASASVLKPVVDGWDNDVEILKAVADGVNVEGLRKEESENAGEGKRKKRKSAAFTAWSTAERVVGRIVPFAHSELIKASIRSALAQAVAGEGGAAVEVVKKAVEHALTVWNKVSSKEYSANGEGYVVSDTVGGVVVDYAPISELLERNLSGSAVVSSHASFSHAVDEYYSKLEVRGESGKIETQRLALMSKVEKIKADQMRRIEELGEEIAVLWNQAVAVEEDLPMTDSVLTIVNALIGKQMAWNEIRGVLEQQRRAGHVVALRIGECDFDKNRVLARIGDVEVWLDLGLSGTQNVARLHGLRKAMIEKLGKTEEQAGIAVKQAEAKLRSDLSKFNDVVDRDRNLSKTRRKFWFEKFYWFLTSENFLVIAGRDATQNEAIYKRYLKAGDVYVHADIHGAATVVVKNHLTKTGLLSPPPLSLAEAGAFSLCHSSAWSSKIVTSAWWVRAEQVSKTAPSGEYLSTGSFMIRGRKNFLPPARLELGIGLLYLLSEDSARDRPAERQIRSALDEEGMGRVGVGEEEDDGVGEAIVTTEKVGGVRKRDVFLREQQAKQSHRKEEKSKGSSVVDGGKVEEGNTGAGEGSKIAGTKRGMKKNSKKKDKYFNSDSEDERIRQKIVGAPTATLPPTVAPTVAIPVVAEGSKGEDMIVRLCYICNESGHLASVCPNRPSISTTPADPTDTTETPLVEEEDVISAIDRLAGKLTIPPDEPLHAIAVCAPYSALSAYQYKVKIVTGSMKRGKAAKLCSQLLGQVVDHPVLKGLTKLIPVEEFSECLVNDVKVAGSGVTKLQVENKKQAKQVRKGAGESGQKPQANSKSQGNNGGKKK